MLFSDDSRKLATFAQGDPETVVWSVDGQEIARLRPGGYPRRFAGDELVLVEEPRAGRPEFEFVARRVSTSDRIPLVRVAGGAWDIEDPSVHVARSGWDIDPARASLVYSGERALFVRPFGDKRAVTVDQRMGEHDTKVTGITVHDGPGRIVSVDESREVRIWDGATHRLLRSLRGTDPGRYFRSPALDSRSLQLAWQSLREQAFTLWDLAGPPDAEPLLMRGGGLWADPGNAVFLDGGRWLATAFTATVAFWPLEMPWARVLRGPASASVIFTSDSKQIVACGTDVTLVYPVEPTAPGRRPITFESGFTCYGAAMDPSGASVLLAAPVKAVLLAPPRRRSPTGSAARPSPGVDMPGRLRQGGPLGGNGGMLRSGSEGPAATYRRPAGRHGTGLSTAGSTTRLGSIRGRAVPAVRLGRTANGLWCLLRSSTLGPGERRERTAQ